MQLAETETKLTGEINVAEYGILNDGTDQTAALTNLFTTGELSDFRGMVTIPYNTKFDINIVYDKLPLGVVVKDYSSINYNNSSGYKNKMISIASKDSLTDDKILIIQSGYHPVLSLNNFRTADSKSAQMGRWEEVQ